MASREGGDLGAMARVRSGAPSTCRNHRSAITGAPVRRNAPAEFFPLANSSVMLSAAGEGRGWGRAGGRGKRSPARSRRLRLPSARLEGAAREPQTPAKGRTAARTSAPRRPGSGLTLRRRGRGVELSAGSSGRRDDGARHHGKSACGSTAGTDGEGVCSRSRAASRPGRGPEGLGAEREESQAEWRAGGTQHERELASARRLPPVGRSRACSLCAVTAAALRAARASIVPVPGPGVEASRAGATPALLAGCPFADRRRAGRVFASPQALKPATVRRISQIRHSGNLSLGPPVFHVPVAPVRRQGRCNHGNRRSRGGPARAGAQRGGLQGR